MSNDKRPQVTTGHRLWVTKVIGDVGHVDRASNLPGHGHTEWVLVYVGLGRVGYAHVVMGHI